jgi:dihydroxyacetone kinase
VSVYVSAPLCAGAKQELARNDGRAGDFRVRAICAYDTGNADRSTLAAIGAAARSATEDSSSIAYIGTTDLVAMRFSEPILDEADISRISADSGEASMARLLRALQRTDDSGSLRESLADELR